MVTWHGDCFARRASLQKSARSAVNPFDMIRASGTILAAPNPMTKEAATMIDDLKRVAACHRNITKARTLARKAEAAFLVGRIDAERVEAVRADLARIVAEEILIANSHATGIASAFNLSDEAAAAALAADVLTLS